jgi:hypothetical protein
MTMTETTEISSETLLAALGGDDVDGVLDAAFHTFDAALRTADACTTWQSGTEDVDVCALAAAAAAAAGQALLPLPHTPGRPVRLSAPECAALLAHTSSSLGRLEAGQPPETADALRAAAEHADTAAEALAAVPAG